MKRGTSTLGVCGHVLDLASEFASDTTCTDCRTNAIVAAQLRGRRGMAIAASARPDERAKVEAAIRQLAATGREFSANDAREIHGIKGGVVGSVFSKLNKAGVIRPTGLDRSSSESTNGHHIFKWIGAAA